MKKIKILIIGMSSNVGGIETYIYNLYKNTDKEKFIFEFIDTTDTGIAYQNELLKDGCGLIKVILREKNYIKHLKELKNLFLNNDYDYIHCNIMSYSWFEPIIMANKYSNAKIIVHNHCGSSLFLKNCNFISKIFDFIGKILTKKIPYIRVACGKMAGDYMFGGKDYYIFNNGIDINKFKFNIRNRNEIRKKFNIKENETVYGLVASLQSVKNHSFLIDLFYEILKKDTNSKLILVGDGPLKLELMNKVNNLRIGENVIFAGMRDDAYKFYSAFDIYIMTSTSEALGIALIEAQVNGLKCYATTEFDRNVDITGNVEFLSLKNTPQDWASYIISNDNKRDKDIIKKIPKNYNSINSCNEVYKFYENNIK